MSVAFEHDCAHIRVVKAFRVPILQQTCQCVAETTCSGATVAAFCRCSKLLATMPMRDLLEKDPMRSDVVLGWCVGFKREIVQDSCGWRPKVSQKLVECLANMTLTTVLQGCLSIPHCPSCGRTCIHGHGIGTSSVGVCSLGT